MKRIVTYLLFVFITACLLVTSTIFYIARNEEIANANDYISPYSASQKPIFYGATEITLDKNVTTEFDVNDSRFRIFAKDFEDGDVTHKIKCTFNNVQPSIVGDYEIKYEVVDSHSNVAQITVPVHILDKEEKECSIIRSLYTLPAMSNLKLAGTERCNNGDRQILGIYLPAGASASIKPIDAEKNLEITFFTNTKKQNSFNSITYSNSEFQTIKNTSSDGNVYSSVPLITSPRLSEDNVVDRIYKFELKFDDSVKALDYYHYKDSEEDFKEKWKESENSFGVVDGEAIMCVVPFGDVDKLSGYKATGYGDPFESLDAFFEYYLEVVNRMDKMIGLEFDAKSLLDQNYRIKYTAVADSSSSAGAYYAGSYIAVCQSTIAPIFQYGWGTLHEIAHGYQGYLGKGTSSNGSLYLNETGNNILAHYINIDSSLYKKSDRRLGELSGCEESFNNFRKTTVQNGETIFHNNDGTYTNCNEKLYMIVNLLDAFEGSETYGKLFKFYRKLANEKGSAYYLTQDVYAMFFAEEYKVNIIPYLNAWTIDVSEETKAEILGKDFPSYMITSDTLGDKLEEIKTAENIELNYGLISEEILKKYNLKSSMKVNIEIDNPLLVKDKNVALYHKGELIKTIKIDGTSFKLSGLDTANYELKFPTVLGYDNKICTIALQVGENELTYVYSLLDKVDYSSNLTEIKILGIYGTVGYSMSFEKNYLQAKILHGGADLGNRNSEWANKPDEVFISVKVENASGNEVYKIEVKGNNYFINYECENPTITLQEGYVIKIYTQKPHLVKVYSKTTKSEISEYNSTDNEISYKITVNGLKLLNAGNFDEQQILYNISKEFIFDKIDSYIASTSEEIISNKRLDTKAKSDILDAYNCLSEQDKQQYSDLISKIISGSKPCISKTSENVTIKQKERINLYGLIEIFDNEDFYIESNSENVRIETNFDNAKTGSYFVKYFVTDSDGNISEMQINVIVKSAGILKYALIGISYITAVFLGFVILLKIVEKKKNSNSNFNKKEKGVI